MIGVIFLEVGKNQIQMEPTSNLAKQSQKLEMHEKGGGTWDIGINHLFRQHLQKLVPPEKKWKMYEKRGGDMGHSYRPFLSKHQWVTYW